MKVIGPMLVLAAILGLFWLALHVNKTIGLVIFLSVVFVLTVAMLLGKKA